LVRSRQEISGGSRRNKEKCILNYFQEVKFSLLKHLVRSRQEISGGSRRNEEKCILNYFQEVKFCLLKHFGQVPSRRQVVQEEMNKNAF
jgi:uncharacterized protein YggL (DUF469 family)